MKKLKIIRDNSLTLKEVFVKLRIFLNIHDICSDLYREYKYFCEQFGLKPISRPNFTIRMGNLGFYSAGKCIYGKSQRCYLNIIV